MRFSTIRPFLLGSSFATLAVAVTQRVIVENLDHVPHGWTDAGPAGADQLIRLSVAFESPGHDGFERLLYQISDPTNSRYGQHVSRDEGLSMIRPPRDAVDSVRHWLSSENIPEHQILDRGLFLDATMTVKKAEKLLAAKYRVFERDSHRVVGTLAYSVPAVVRQHIAAIQPTTFFGIHNSMRSSQWQKLKTEATGANSADGNSTDAQTDAQTQAQEDTCTTMNTPGCLRKLYKMNNNFTEPDHRSLLGIVGFSKQAAQYDQLNKYIEAYATYARGASFTVELINNGTNPQGPNYPGGEANMDIQIAVAMAYKVPVRFYSTGGEDHDFIPDLDISDKQKEHIEPWLQFVSHLMELPDRDLPQVMSVSYGVNEQAVPKPYAKMICRLFGQLALRGMSVIVSSGDTGPGVSCRSNDGKNATKFLPAFPATCPYVTSIGATEGKGPEKASNFSSGGFSEYWSRPHWQAPAVEKYLDLHGDTWGKYYNRQGRGFPDVAAQGLQYPIFNHDKIESGGGTSASAPLFASMIALINDDRLKSGKPPMGFLNPWLYRSASAFTDIKDGRSEGCKGTSYSHAPAPRVPGAGWDAVEGWDPVTGLGTPDYEQLYNSAMY